MLSDFGTTLAKRNDELRKTEGPDWSGQRGLCWSLRSFFIFTHNYSRSAIQRQHSYPGHNLSNTRAY